jgi:pimeloyl-ACP methyl ester carboxylesterase
MPRFLVPDGTQFEMNYEIIEDIVPQDTLFIHGNFASNRWWYPTAEALRGSKLANHTGSLILAEFRGCGQSSAPLNLSEITISRLANDYIFLLKELTQNRDGKIRSPIHVVGHSTGGLIAGLCMSRAPELFGKAVLLDPVGARGIPFQQRVEDVYEMMKKDKILAASVLAATIYQCDTGSDIFRQVVVEDAFKAVAILGASVVKAFSGIDFTRDFSMVKNPVQVLHGEFDQLLSLEASRETAMLFTNGNFEVLRNQGHCSNIENPSFFAKKLISFLYN